MKALFKYFFDIKKVVIFLMCFASAYNYLTVGQKINYINETELILDNNSKLYTYDSTTYLYTKPHPLKFVPNIFRNIVSVPSVIFRKENVWPIIGVVASTGILIYYDQPLVDGAQRFGRYIGLGTDNNTYNLSPSSKIPLYVPTSLPAALYYIGDGITELSINAGFYIYGYMTNDIRAIRTASELTEGIAVAGIYIQAIKHISGRETPMRASQPGGVWRPLPLADYHNSVPKYDAFASGHLITAMVTTTIISMNYPEYKWIKPIAYTLIAINGYQMMNNGVHWMGDYPLALGLGYVIGKIAVNNGRNIVLREKQLLEKTPNKYKFDISPVYYGPGGAGLSLSLKF